MNEIRSIVAVVVCTTLLMLCPARSFGQQTFENFEGQLATIEQFFDEKHWLVVVIWSFRCPICQKELPTYVDLARRQESGSFTVIGLSIDGHEGFGGAWALLEELGDKFKSLIGEADEVADFVLAHSHQPFRGTPTIMIFDPGGILVAFKEGPVPVDSIEKFIAQSSN
jgi:thiol-disulfide isomerase/thioredoxin